MVAIAFTYEPADGLIRMITFADSVKVKNLRRAGDSARAAVGQVDGRRWLSFEGPARVVDDPARVAKAVALHGAFWHRDFGRVRSHGCVNLAPIDAKWVFGFTGPRVPVGWHAAYPTDRNTGTLRACARSNASSPQGNQSTGLCACWRR